MSVPSPASGKTHNCVLRIGAPGVTTDVGLMLPNGDLKFFSRQPYTPFAPRAGEGEASERNFCYTATWELNTDWSRGTGHIVEGKVESDGYVFSQGTDLGGASGVGPCLYTAKKGVVLPAPAEVSAAGAASGQTSIGNFIQFINTSVDLYGLTADKKIYRFETDGTIKSTPTSHYGLVETLTATGKQLFTDGTTLYATQGASNAVRKTADGYTWTDHTFNADFIAIRDEGNMAYIATATLTPAGTGYTAVTIGWPWTTATSMVWFKGALWIGKPEGLFTWIQGRIDERFKVAEMYNTDNFSTMVVHRNWLYFNISNHLYCTDGINQWIELYPEDANGFGTVDCMFPTLGPLLIGSQFKSIPPARLATNFTVPGTCADNDGTGTVAWSNPSNAAAADGTYATVTVPYGASSHYLFLTNFGLSVPAGATITGVSVDILGIPSDGFNAKLIKNGAVTGTTKTFNLEIISENFIDHPSSGEGNISLLIKPVFGGVGDLWGATFTQADVVANTFGVAIWSSPTNAPTMSVDAVRLNVYYETSTTYPALNYAFLFWGPESPGLHPLWSDGDGARPINAIGATTLYGNLRIYFSQTTTGTYYLDFNTRYEPRTYHTYSSYSSYIDLTEHSGGTRTARKWYYQVILSVRKPSPTTLVRVDYSIDGAEWKQMVDQDGAVVTLRLSGRSVGCFFPLDTRGTWIQLRLYMYTTDSSIVAELTHVTVRGAVEVRPRYQFSFPADCSEQVQTLTGGITDHGEAVRSRILSAASQGYPCKFQDPYGNWHLVEFRPPSPLDTITGVKTPDGNSPERIFSTVQVVLMEIEALGSTAGLPIWSPG